MPSEQVISNTQVGLLRAYLGVMEATIGATIATLTEVRDEQADEKLKAVVGQVLDKANSTKSAIDDLDALFRTLPGYGGGDPHPGPNVDH